MKSFKGYIKEVHHSGGISQDIPQDFHRLDQEAVKARVNTWLEGCSNMEYMSVEGALSQLAGKVQQIGLVFDSAVEVNGQNGSVNLPVHLFGEKHDPAETHALDIVIPEDLSMSVSWESSGNGGYRISAKLN